MLHRNKKENDVHQGKWNGLGGKVHGGETPEECAIREVQEESGLIVRSLEMCGFITFPMFSHNKDWYVFVFTVDSFSGQLLNECSEGELHWIPNQDLMGLNLWPGDRIFLPWLEQDRFFSGCFVYENGQLLSHSVSFH